MRIHVQRKHLPYNGCRKGGEFLLVQIDDIIHETRIPDVKDRCLTLRESGLVTFRFRNDQKHIVLVSFWESKHSPYGSPNFYGFVDHGRVDKANGGQEKIIPTLIPKEYPNEGISFEIDKPELVTFTVKIDYVKGRQIY